MGEEKASKRNRWEDLTSEATRKEDKRRRKQKQKSKTGSRHYGSNNSSTTTPVDQSKPTTDLDLPDDMVLLTSLNALSLCISNPIDKYKRLNLIEEGSYGIVYRAEDIRTGEIVALKKMKFEEKSPGFPVTSLREINALKDLNHPNILSCREVVVGSTHRDVYIVMDFIEHDLKTLMDNMEKPFLQSEVKTLMHQLLSATQEMHSKWIMHRDLKTSNLLMTNRGMMKVADFGLATSFGDPEADLTRTVVTLWYRAPELLLASKNYDSAIDMWSIGCIFAELILNEPFLRGSSEVDQLHKICKYIGIPSEQNWTDFRFLPGAKSLQKPSILPIPLSDQFKTASPMSIDLLSRLLTLDPAKRITAEQALRHPYLTENPPPKNPDLFPSFPSKGGLEHRRKVCPE